MFVITRSVSHGLFHFIFVSIENRNDTNDYLNNIYEDELWHLKYFKFNILQEY